MRRTAILRITLAFALAIPLPLPQAQAEPAASWPRITQAKAAGACRQALVIAKLAFNSSATKLADAAPVFLPEKQAGSGILLAPDGGNADGTGFIHDETAIEWKDAPRGEFRPLLVQKTPQDGVRFAVTQKKMNWQGDWYGLYLVDASIDADKFAEALGEEKTRLGASVAFEEAWQRPWLIRDPDIYKVVGIDTQHPANFLADWIVHAPVNGALTRACHISFRPEAKRATELLPRGSLRALAAVLASIAGIERPRGYTDASVANAAASAWANLVLRPWALAEPHNSTQEIADALGEWTKKSPAYLDKYRRMQALLPKARQDLAAYYRTVLRKSPQEAAALAGPSLERAVGAHFVFPKKGG